MIFKGNRPATLVAAASCAAALLILGCSRGGNADQAKAAAPARPLPTPMAAPANSVGSAVASAPDAPASWEVMEGLTYDQRAAFMAGLSGLLARLDSQIGELAQKRSTMTTGTTDWDVAMKEVTESRSYLAGLASELGAASPESWSQEKDKVGGAWRRSQEACDKVRMSTTS